MAVIKDLGAVTAYAAAVEGGYTGTKAEFETLMASYASVAEEAAESAQSASQSAESASASASTATTKASEASASASTASSKASEAAQSASQARTTLNAAADTIEQEKSSALSQITSLANQKTNALNAKYEEAMEAIIRKGEQIVSIITKADETAAQALTAANNAENHMGYLDNQMKKVQAALNDVSIDPDDLGLEQDPDTYYVYPTYKGVRSENGIPLAGSADHVTSYLTYASYDGSTTYKVVTCLDGVPQEAAPTGLTRANSSDGHYSYTFVGWALEPDAQAADPSALDNVIADRTVYAAYTWDVRTYTVAWNNSNGTRLETDENVPWGTTPTYNGSTPQNPSGSAPFIKWTPDIAKVTGNATYTASYTPVWKVYFYLDSTHLDATVDVLDGGTAVYPNGTPAHPTDPDSYEFTGWSPTPTNVRGNLSVYAQWKRTAAKWETPGFDVSGAYAVQWHYGLEMPQLARGGAAAAFSNPVPAEGASGSGSSPFDSIAPWNGMEIYVDINGTPQKYAAGMNLTENDILVKIPEFYYKTEKDTTKQMWTWAVSPTAKTGYEKHPGSGRYVGRYHTGGSSSGVYSRSGVSPLVDTSQTNFRTYSANKGTGWHMMDLATWSAIQLLYLVEFADFGSQTVLGKGWNTGSIGSMGGTDSASYHTVKATGAHNQYRNIEDPFSNCYDWIDGFVGSNNSDTYAAAKDSYAGGNSDLTALGFKLPSSGAIRGFGYSATVPWAFIPDTASGTDHTTYVCDRVYSSSSLYPAYVGGNCNDYADCGFFCFNASFSASYAYGFLGSRLLKT